MSIKRLVKIGAERESAHAKFERGEMNFSEVEKADARFWKAVDASIEYGFGNKECNAAFSAAGIGENFWPFN